VLRNTGLYLLFFIFECDTYQIITGSWLNLILQENTYFGDDLSNENLKKLASTL